MVESRSNLVSPDDAAGVGKKISRRLLLANGLSAAGFLFTGDLQAIAQKLTTKSGVTVDLGALKNKMKGKVVVPSDPEFDKFAYGELFNLLRPKRAPEVIARVANEQDVCEAVKFARANKMKVVVRGGGHNWCSPSLRTSGMMIDLTDLNQVVSIDETNKKAVLQPILSNREVQKHLNAKNLSYPTGHCPPVKISGYLLSGGMSWNQGVWGPGVGSVEAIDIVTPDGELITASKDKNFDYFWAARGAGPGFFGVAVKYHLKLYPLPKYITASSYTYSLEHVGAVAEWLGKTALKLPSKVELSLFMLKAPADLKEKAKAHKGKVCMVTATVFANSEQEAKDAVKLLETCPVIDKCLAKSQNEKVTFEKLFDMSGALWPDRRYNKVDALFSDASPKVVFESVRDHFMQCPSEETLIMYAFFTGPNVPAPLLDDAAFSMSHHLYGGPWTMWPDKADNKANIDWHEKCVKLLLPHMAGHYVSETDTVGHPEYIKKSYTPKNYARVEELRRKHDPKGVFFSYSDGLS